MLLQARQRVYRTTKSTEVVFNKIVPFDKQLTNLLDNWAFHSQGNIGNNYI